MGHGHDDARGRRRRGPRRRGERDGHLRPGTRANRHGERDPRPAQAIADSLNAYVPNSVANELDAFGYDATVDPDDIVIDSVTVADEDTGTVDIWWEFEAGSTFEETIWEDTLDIVSETPESLDGFIEDAFAEVGVDVESPVGDALQDAATSSFAPRGVERDARGASREAGAFARVEHDRRPRRCRATSSRRRSRRRGRP